MSRGLILVPKNWGSFQHYKDRAPAWIKLHRGLLDDFEFNMLPVASRALAPMLWLLASEHEQGRIISSFEKLAFRFRMSVDDIKEAINPLVEGGFFTDESGTLADCKQRSIPEEEIEEQDKTEGDLPAVAKATRPSVFDDFWKAYPKRLGANPKSPAQKKFDHAVKSGCDPGIIIAAARAYGAECDRLRISNTVNVAQAITWLNQQRWTDYSQQSDELSPETEALMRSKGYEWIGGKWVQDKAHREAALGDAA